MDKFTSLRFQSISDWRELLRWHFLKDPLAICTAVVGAVMIAILSNSFDPSNTFNLVWIVTTVLLVMVFGSAERILVEAIFRMIGTVIGVGVGALIALGHTQMLKHGASSVGLYAYQISLQVLLIFLVAVMSRLFRVIGEVFFFVGLTAAILVFSPDQSITYQRTLSVLLAIAAALICTITFHYTMSDELLFREHRGLASRVLKLTEFAISSRLSEKHEFDIASSSIRRSLTSAGVVWAAYSQWRALTLRKPVYDFAFLTEALRPLYYEVFSLYWSHIETALRPGDARILYCDTEGDYDVLFRPVIHSILDAVRELSSGLIDILEPAKMSPNTRRTQFRKFTDIVGSHFVLNLQLLNMRYVDNRLLCFSSRSQRWSMCDYLLSLACVLIELTEYLKRLAQMFAKEDLDQYEDIVIKFMHWKERLNLLKFSSRIILDITPAYSHVAPTVGEVVPNPDYRRSEPRAE
jgi:hypothetical protein